MKTLESGEEKNLINLKTHFKSILNNKFLLFKKAL